MLLRQAYISMVIDTAVFDHRHVRYCNLLYLQFLILRLDIHLERVHFFLLVGVGAHCSGNLIERTVRFRLLLGE